ncbi:MAG: hypothetical protein HFG54_06770 [Lachnospiraceae bacterium]|nr:hypothetical protein [Lachnospiraceae bacterium]
MDKIPGVVHNKNVDNVDKRRTNTVFVQIANEWLECFRMLSVDSDGFGDRQEKYGENRLSGIGRILTKIEN